MRKLFNTRITETSASLGLLIIRLAFCSALMMKGFQKLQHFDTMKATFMDPFGLGHSTSLALLIFAEFFCSILVGIGLISRLACIPIIIGMAVAFFKAHQGHFFNDQPGGGQNAGLFLCVFLALLITGPGKYSLDRAIFK